MVGLGAAVLDIDVFLAFPKMTSADGDAIRLYDVFWGVQKRCL